MKKLVFCLFLVSITLYSYGQSTLSLSVKNVENIKNFIVKNFKVDSKFTDTACMNTAVFIKFKIIDDHVDSIVFSNKVPGEIKGALKEAILSTNGFWKSTDFEKLQMKSTTYLLPIILYYQVGCSPGGQLVSVVKENPDVSVISKFRKLEIPLHEGLQNMLKFEDGSDYSKLNCLLISPVILGMMN